MFKPVYAINAKSATEADVLIYGVIGDSFWGDGNPSKKFVTDFKALEQKYDRINVRINSPGGSVTEGLPMFNTIKASKKDVHTYVDGIAYSMGAMIALAGKTVHAAKGSLFLLHNVSGFAMGNAQDMRNTAEEMDIYDQVLGELIADKTGDSLEAVQKNWMDYKDHLMSATEAHDSKLIDVVEDYETKEMPKNVREMKIEDVIAFYNPVQAPAQPKAWERLEVMMNKIFKQNDKEQDNMGLLGSDFPKLKALKNKKPEEITDEVIAEVIAELTEKGITNAVIITSATLEEAENNADTITNSLSAINKALGLEGDKAHTDLAVATTALAAAHKEAVDQAEEFGEQPGATPTAPVTNQEKGKQTKQKEPAMDKNADKMKKFETSYDRELKELQAKKNTDDDPFKGL